MTAQTSEILFENCKEHRLLTTPLEQMWASRRKRRLRPRFEWPSTTCWRGYVGTWLIEDSRLHLAELWGLLGGTEVNFGHIFPGRPQPMFAEWYSGELRVPLGPVIAYGGCGFDSVFETEALIRVEGGTVTGRRTIRPEPPKPRLGRRQRVERPDGYAG